jgi:DNA-binding MarR family transcriptional regulator
MTDTVENLVRQLYGMGVVRRELGRHALAELGSQGFTALAIVHVHGPVRVSEVAQRLAVDLSVASRQVSALIDAGYLDRRPDAGDRRATLVSVTDDGRRALEESHGRMVHAFGRVLEDWSDEDVASLAGGLERLRADFTRTADGDQEVVVSQRTVAAEA